jgi:hypothetical protein
MTGRKLLLRPILAAIAWAVPCALASADVIQFTGNVENDMPIRPGIGVIVSSPDPVTGEANPYDVGQAKWMTDRGWITGWNIKDLRFHYDAGTDNLYVGVNFFGIAGDADGNGDPGGSDPLMRQSMGYDYPSLGGRESIAVAFDINKDRKYDIFAGVPARKDPSLSGISQFTVAKFADNGAGIPYSVGESLAAHNGGVAFDPSAERPDFQFTIKNFSMLPGMPAGFMETDWYLGVGAFAGTVDDIVAGEDSIPYTALLPQQIPEPATLIGWSAAIAGGLMWRARRRRAGRPAR